MTFREELAYYIYPKIFEKYDEYRKAFLTTEREIEVLEKEYSKKNKLYQEALKQKTQLQKKIYDITRINATEEFLEKNYKKIPNLAYQQKRKFQGKPISILLQELFTPDAFEIQKVRKRLNMRGDVLDRAKTVGNWTARNFTWTDDRRLDKSGDYYVMPNEAIVYRKVDCEDHAFVNASLEPEIIVAYGFYNVNNQRVAHAWNLVFQNNKLYHMETVGNHVEFYNWDTDKYETYFIVTPSSTFKLKSGVQFGHIAHW